MCLKTALLSLSAGECDTLLSGTSDLECPTRLQGVGQPDAGFLYFVIKKEKPRTSPYYGMLKLNPSGEILFQDGIILNFWKLASVCLRIFQPSGKTP